jgi:hypothetical protein
VKVHLTAFLSTPLVDFDVPGPALAHLVAEEVLNRAGLAEQALDEAVFTGLGDLEAQAAFPHRVPVYAGGGTAARAAREVLQAVELIRAGKSRAVLLVAVQPGAAPPTHRPPRELLLWAKARGVGRSLLDETLLQSIARFRAFTGTVEYFDLLQPFFLPGREWRLHADEALPFGSLSPEQAAMEPALSEAPWDYTTRLHLPPPVRGACGYLLVGEALAEGHPFPYLVEVGQTVPAVAPEDWPDGAAAHALTQMDHPGRPDALFTGAPSAVDEAVFAGFVRNSGDPATACETVNPWGSDLAAGWAGGCSLVRRFGLAAAWLRGEGRRRALVLETLAGPAGLGLELLRP